jgi:hypothetical protein
MNLSSRRSKMPAELSASTQQQLNMYAIAAGAAGIGVLALAQPAEAKIIYTPAHVKVYFDLMLDLNHDGINDFYFNVISRATSSGQVGGLAVARERGGNNRIRGHRGKYGGSYASALRAGALIGPKGPFTNAFEYATMAANHINSIKGTTTFFGFWANGGKGVKNRYLGLKFFIKGKVHFGWARLTFTYSAQNHAPGFFSGLLTGYAYETIPSKAIIAGATESSDDKSTVEQPNPASLVAPAPAPAPGPATLGSLALGAPGLSIWRREDVPTTSRVP